MKPGSYVAKASKKWGFDASHRGRLIGVQRHDQETSSGALPGDCALGEDAKFHHVEPLSWEYVADCMPENERNATEAEA